jgi:hypothetical protein
MSTLPSLPNLESYSTKDIMLMLSKAILAENMSTDDQNKIPIEYISLFAEHDCLYAKARETANNPNDLVRLAAIASAIKENINKDTKAKTEYKLYLEQLEAGIKKAEEQLAKQKELAKTLDMTLPELHKMYQDNAQKLIRPGLTPDNPIMNIPIKKTLEKGDNLVKQFKEVLRQNELIKEGLEDIIEATKIVAPADVIKEATAQASVDVDQERPIRLPGE